MVGAAGENFPFRLQRASFPSVWRHSGREIEARPVCPRGLASANIDNLRFRVRGGSVGPRVNGHKSHPKPPEIGYTFEDSKLNENRDFLKFHKFAIVVPNMSSKPS